MGESLSGTWYEEYLNTPESERRYYVYLWLEQVDGEWVPFYVGMGSGKRVSNRSNRSRTLREHIEGKEIKQIIVAPYLPCNMAMYLEHRIKVELKSRGFGLIDGEDDHDERKRRQAEGIRKAIDSGVRFGRIPKKVDLTLLPGETVTEAAARLGISRATYYRKAKELGVL